MSPAPKRINYVAEMIWNGTAKPGITYTGTGRPLTVNEMKDAMVRLYDESNNANFNVFDEMLSPDFVSYGGAGFQDLVGAQAFRDLYTQFLTSLPDLHFRVDQVVAEGNMCGVRGRLSGTHKGNFMGSAPPTGRFISWTGTAIFRFDQNGFMDARWQEWDGLSVMQQMGVIPAPALPQGTNFAPQPEPIPPALLERALSHAVGYSSPVHHKRAMRRLIEEVFNGGNLSIANDIYHPEATYPSQPDIPVGSEGIRTILNMYQRAMPDFHVDVKSMITDGDMVLTWLAQSGTHKGELMGVQPSGKKVNWGQIIIARFEGGKIVESWSNEDILGLMQQLGVGGDASSGA